MKNMKLGFFGALAIAGSLFVAGCSDPCKDVTCVNGECVEGDCVCDAGYEGTDCGTAINAKFSGSYSLTETCSVSGSASYAITVAPKSGTTDEINITGLWEEPQAIVTGQVDADGLGFTIERQTLGTTGNQIESTNGTINADGSTITLTYTVYNGSVTVETCTGSMSK